MAVLAQALKFFFLSLFSRTMVTIFYCRHHSNKVPPSLFTSTSLRSKIRFSFSARAKSSKHRLPLGDNSFIFPFFEFHNIVVHKGNPFGTHGQGALGRINPYLSKRAGQSFS